MCLAVPTRVEKLLEDNRAVVELSGVKREIGLDLLDNVQVGDYVIVHVGYALEKLDPEEARQTLELFAQMEEHFAREAAEATEIRAPEPTAVRATASAQPWATESNPSPSSDETDGQ